MLGWDLHVRVPLAVKCTLLACIRIHLLYVNAGMDGASARAMWLATRATRP